MSDDRDRLEKWLDRHNHKLELVRTIFGGGAFVFSMLVFLRLFGVI